MNSQSIKSIIKIAAIALAVALASCVKDVDNVNLPNTPQKLVVQSFISPGDSIFVTVFASQPINYNIPVDGNNYYDRAFDTIKTATVEITSIDNNSSITVPYNAKQKKYALPPSAFSIEKGNEYELKVIADKFETVSGRTIVPLGNATSKIERIDTLSVDEWGYSELMLIGSISDPANVENFYNTLIYSLKQYTWDENTETYISNFSNMLVSDSNFDGQPISIRHEFSSYEDDYSSTLSTESEVYEVDMHYYKFHKSLENIYDIMDNPFTESSHLYSNIEGGLGVFGSYITIKKTTLSN